MATCSVMTWPSKVIMTWPSWTRRTSIVQCVCFCSSAQPVDPQTSCDCLSTVSLAYRTHHQLLRHVNIHHPAAVNMNIHRTPMMRGCLTADSLRWHRSAVDDSAMNIHEAGVNIHDRTSTPVIGCLCRWARSKRVAGQARGRVAAVLAQLVMSVQLYPATTRRQQLLCSAPLQLLQLLLTLRHKWRHRRREDRQSSTVNVVPATWYSTCTAITSQSAANQGSYRSGKTGKSQGILCGQGKSGKGQGKIYLWKSQGKVREIIKMK